jgi:hypothetical protein
MKFNNKNKKIRQKQKPPLGVWGLVGGLFMLCFMHLSVFAQESLMPFPTHAGLSENAHKEYIKKKQNRRITAVSLPFFEDFYQDGVYPDPNKWQDNFVYVNQTFALNPVSIGMAIFDGLNPVGQPYSLLSGAVDTADRLTSQPIDLLGLSDSDRVILSFLYAFNTLSEEPDPAKDFLYLQLMNESGEWQTVWQRTPGNNEDSIVFRQVFIAIDTPFLHDNFQFRFFNIGNISGLNDVWAVDYIRLDKNRDSIFDRTIRDMAFQYPAPSMLGRYYNMPYNQYDDSLQRSDTMTLSVKNNFNNPTTDFVDRYTATILSDTVGAYNGPSRDFFPGTENRIVYPLFNVPKTYTNDTVIVEINFSFDVTAEDSGIAVIKNNNRLTHRQIFSNYFSYDDGTPERAYWTKDSDNYKLAVKYALTVPDTLRAIKFQFTQVKSDIGRALFAVAVWKNVQVGSTNEQLIYRHNGLRIADLAKEFGYDTINGMYYYSIKPEFIVDNNYQYPLVLSDSFLVGVIVEDENTLSIGFDINNNKKQYNFFVNGRGDRANRWLRTGIDGTMMINPVFGKKLPDHLITPIKNNPTYAVKIYPNPAQNYIHISGIKSKTQVTVLDLRGNIINTFETGTDKVLNIENLPPSIYIIQLKELETNKLGVIKFIKTNE